jgi:hypothetical protein
MPINAGVLASGLTCGVPEKEKKKNPAECNPKIKKDVF